MPFSEPSFYIGIEEEYHLVDRSTRALVSDPPTAMLEKCKKRTKNLVRPEFLKSQIEIGTRPCETLRAAGEDLAWLRKTVAEVAGEHGFAPIAASTHPFSEWRQQKYTDRERYHVLARNMQAVARRLSVCGMHVHVGIDDNQLRIDLMNQVSYFLPHLLALSTSSPFWCGEDTGLKSYRLSIFNELPRTGLPERFESFGEYQRHVAILSKAGVIKDATMLWWDVRLSARFPTIEMRITDVCPLLDDAVAIAALFLCIVRMLYRLRRGNQRWRVYAPMLINENRWRAQRYGFDEGLMDFGKGKLVPCRDLLEELLELVGEDAQALDCVKEVGHCREIIKRGSGAHRQLAVFTQAIIGGAGHKDALDAVVDWLIAETVRGL